MTLDLLARGSGDPDGIARWRPDLVALQGAAGDRAADLLGPEYRIVRPSRRSVGGIGAVFGGRWPVGAVIGSRWPVGAVHEIDLRVTPRADPWCAAVLAEIEAPGGPLLFVHHRPAREWGQARERELQAVACARFVEGRLAGRNLRVVLAGDLGDTPDAASVRFWTGRQPLHGTRVAYRDAWAARPRVQYRDALAAGPRIQDRDACDAGPGVWDRDARAAGPRAQDRDAGDVGPVRCARVWDRDNGDPGAARREYVLVRRGGPGVRVLDCAPAFGDSGVVADLGLA